MGEPQATLDNTDCKQFTPGLVYHPGDAVVFRNNGASLQRVYINGVLIGGRILPPIGGILKSLARRRSPTKDMSPLLDLLHQRLL